MGQLRASRAALTLAARPSLRRGAKVLAVLALAVVAACGNQLPEAELLAAVNGQPDSEMSGGSGATTPSQSAGGAGTPSTSIGGADASGGSGLPGSPNGSSGATTPEDPTPDNATTGEGTGPKLAAQGCDRALSPVKIASVGQQSGLIGALTVAGTKGVQAWVAMVNERGGVNCHPVEYIVADDGGDPSRHQALVKELVEQRGVHAFVYMDAVLTGQASVDYLTERGIPVIGTENSGEHVYSSPVYFPQASSGNFLLMQPLFAASENLRARELTRVGLLACLEAAQCGVFVENFNDWAKEAGLTPVYTGQASLATGDFTSQCQRAQNAGVQALVTGMDASSNSRIARSCESIGYHPVLVSNGQAATQNSLEDPRLDGFLLGVQLRPPYGETNAAIDELSAAVAQYAPGVVLDSNVVVGWTAAKLFEAATTNLGEPPTSESILEGLWSVRDNDLGGLTYPLTFTRGQTAPRVFCYWLIEIRDGRFTSPDGNKRACT